MKKRDKKLLIVMIIIIVIVVLLTVVMVKVNYNKDIKMSGKVVTSIKDTSDEFATCAEAIETFYEDDKYTYSFHCIMSDRIMVYYDDGTSENVKQALNKGHISIRLLKKYKIRYIKEKK